jgi:poly-beta-1,6-N-acetyl-D-glucosamine synthase
MFILLILSALIYLSYLILILRFCIGWNKIPSFQAQETILPEIFISVVVACKNEQDNILKLISSLSEQTYRNFELILVNDHSTDLTRSIIETAQSTNATIQLFDAVKHGKKKALKEGIFKSKGELIVTTDADCIHHKQWLETIISFQKTFPSDLLICPVGFLKKKTLFANLQKLEFSSLVASGAGACGAGMPILCNGANLVFTKNIWIKSQKDLHEEELSGDDMFLLESVKRQGGMIRFLKSESAFAFTDSVDSLNSFFKQRKRWASKASSYTDWQIIFTACIIFSVNFLLLFFLGLVSCNLISCKFFFILFISKYLIDLFFLNYFKGFFQINKVFLYSFLLSIIYPFYIVIVAFSSHICKSKTW